MYSDEQKNQLLDLVHHTIDEYFQDFSPTLKTTKDPDFLEERGAFVTLKKMDHLRGCIGYIEPVASVYETIQKLSIQSAFNDSRFPPLEESEWPDCQAEISILSLPQPLKSAEYIQVGTHGVILRSDRGSGVFLPQVPIEQGWNRLEYLEQLGLKSGLDRQAWSSSQLFTFEAIVFSRDHC